MFPASPNSQPGLAPRHCLADLDAAATLAAAGASLRARRHAEVHDLLLVAHWADLHSDHPVEDPDTPAHARDRAAVDHDHPTPYDTLGPPGQTGTHNSAPLGRTHHRWKTFGGYRCRQAGPGRYLWTTPHGHYNLRDHTGTHRLDPDDGELILHAPPGVDIYPGREGRAP